VKKGKGKLTREETLIKKAVEEGRVSWRTIFLKDENYSLFFECPRLPKRD
jgi:predicted Holliday junction resolvase-like endonuclease